MDHRIVSGHGHVAPRADGSKARCGGPVLCPQCAQELIARQATQIALLTAELAQLRRRVADGAHGLEAGH